MLLANIDFRQLKTSATYCALHVAQTVFPETAGWATNLRSGCVQHAISYGLARLSSSGQLDQIMENYYVPAVCSANALLDGADSELTEQQLDHSPSRDYFIRKYGSDERARQREQESRLASCAFLQAAGQKLRLCAPPLRTRPPTGRAHGRDFAARRAGGCRARAIAPALEPLRRRSASAGRS